MSRNLPGQSPGRSPVARIKFPVPQFGTIGREQFESIADLRLYDDASNHSGGPPLTLRRLIEPSGPRQSPCRRICFHVGLLERIIQLLEAAGWRVVLPPNDCLPDLLPSNSVEGKYAGCREPLSHVIRRPYSLLNIPNTASRLQIVVGLRQQFPDKHLLVVAKNKVEAQLLAEMLEDRLQEPVTWGSEPRTTYPWTHVDAVGTFSDRSVVDWSCVIFWNAEDVLSLTSLSQLVHMFGSVRIGFLLRDERNMHELERAIIEGMFGPVVYRSGDEYFSAVVATWLPAPTYPAQRRDTLYGRKRMNFWLNYARNRLIANAARAFSSNDHRALVQMGLDETAGWLMAELGTTSPTVAIVVENPEHGRALLKLLPEWQLAIAGDGVASDVRFLGDRTIITLSRALTSTIAVDILVYAAGSGERWIDNLMPIIGLDGGRMLIVDVPDDCDDRASREWRSRRKDFQRRGWRLLDDAIRTDPLLPGRAVRATETRAALETLGDQKGGINDVRS